MPGNLPLKILFVTQEDPFYGRHFFAEFARCYDPLKIEVLGVAVQKPLGRSRLGAFKRVYSFYGFWNSIKLALISVLLAAAGFLSLLFRRGYGGDYTLRQVLKRENVSIIELGDINSEKSKRELRALAPDLIISMSASQKFGPAVLELPRIACLNVHSGELPRYRGMLTVFWQLYEGRDYTVPTVHVMDEKLDAGPIVESSRCPVGGNDSLYEATVKTKICAARLLADVLDMYLSGEVLTRPNDSALAKRFSFPGRTEASKFRKTGRRLV
jgi:methionyl-tRNA formyltransferase